MFKRDLILRQEYFAFLLLNLFDLFLTGFIFRHQGLEANGVANWILTRFGLAGFAVYKFLLVTVLIFACEGISFQSIYKARIIVTAGCIVYVGVVLWECGLIASQIYGFHVPFFPPPPAPDDNTKSSLLQAPMLLRHAVACFV